MKTIIIASLMTLAFINVSGQDKSDTIKNIDQKVQALKNDTSYWISIMNNEAFLDTGFIKQAGQGYGQLTGLFKNGKICIIHELIGIKLLKDVAETEYYFSDGKLIFVYEKENYGPAVYIDSSGTVDQKIKGPDFEGRYYFNNDKLINTNTKGKQQILPNEMYFDSQSKEGQLLLSAQKYKNLLSMKMK
jgi:hypothetical protein